MKRFHVHAHVNDLPTSIAFYSKLFAARARRASRTITRSGCLTIRASTSRYRPAADAIGVDHLGIQTDDEHELAELKSRASAADMSLLDEGETTCCYARSEKHWVTDPQGIAWEHFHTLGDIPVFSEKKAVPGSACCVASAPQGQAIDVPLKQAASCCA